MKLNRSTVTVLICFLAASIAAAQTLPATPAGKALQQWIEVYNAGDPARTMEFLKANYAAESLAQRPAEPRARSIRDMLRDVGPLQVKKVVRSSDTEVVALAHAAETDSDVELSLRMKGDKVDGVSIDVAPPSFSEKLSDAELVKRLDQRMQKLAAADRFSGAVAVQKNGRRLFTGGYGKADRDAGAAIDPDTQFNLGSMNKMFTAVAMAQLAQQGKVKFTDTIAQHLPEYPNQEVAKKVTIHHLLSHTSGIGNYMKPEFFRTKVEKLSDYLPFFANDALQFEPGQGWSYSNAAFIVAGMIIEKASGVDYFTYVKKNIFDRAGMTRSDYHDREAKIADSAIGYTRMNSPDGERRSAQQMLPWRGGPAGGGYSTVADLLKFADALLSHKLLNAEYTTLITTQKSKPGDSGPDDVYGYGFGISKVNGQRVIGHSGGFPGTSAILDVYPDSRTAVVVLSNYDPPTATRVSEWISARIAGGAAQAAKN